MRNYFIHINTKSISKGVFNMEENMVVENDQIEIEEILKCNLSIGPFESKIVLHNSDEFKTMMGHNLSVFNEYLYKANTSAKSPKDYEKIINDCFKFINEFNVSQYRYLTKYESDEDMRRFTCDMICDCITIIHTLFDIIRDFDHEPQNEDVVESTEVID